MPVLTNSQPPLGDTLQGLPEYCRRILNVAHEALGIVDANFRVVSANARFYEILGMKHGAESCNPGCEAALEDPRLRHVLEENFSAASHATRQLELDFDTPGIGRRTMVLRLHSLSSPEGGNPLQLVSLSDATDLVGVSELLRREIEGCTWAKVELKDSERRFQMLVETMNDGLVVRDESGRITYVNTRFCEMLGCRENDIVGRLVTEFLDEENSLVYLEQIRKRERGRHDPYEMRWVRKDGLGIDTLMSPRPLYDAEGRISGSFAIVTEMTERKRIETALLESEMRLHLLSSHLLKAQEHEREHISRELHDQLGQDLTVLKYQVRFIEKRLRKDQGGLRDACRDTLQHIDDLFENIRRISRNLSPYNLQNLGLTASIELIANEFSKHSSTEVLLNVENIDGLLPQEAEISLYRIFQEAFTNIGKHARATAVRLSITLEPGFIVCSIQDNGIGFNVGDARSGMSHVRGIGLATMEERARMIGGVLEISSRIGAGACVSLRAPVGSERSG